MVAFFEFAAKITRTGKSCFFRYGEDGIFCCRKQSGSTREAILDQAKCGTRQYSNKFHFMMPVPVDAVKVKRPDIFVVIRKRKALVSMRNGFVKFSSVIILVAEEIFIFMVLPQKIRYFGILYHNKTILCNDRESLLRYNSIREERK